MYNHNHDGKVDKEMREWYTKALSRELNIHPNKKPNKERIQAVLTILSLIFGILLLVSAGIITLENGQRISDCCRISDEWDSQWKDEMVNCSLLIRGDTTLNCSIELMLLMAGD